METNNSFSNTLSLFESKNREYLDTQNKLNGKLIDCFKVVQILIQNILDDMLDQNSMLANDLNIVLNKLNDHNNTTVNIFLNMKEKVIFFFIYIS